MKLEEGYYLLNDDTEGDGFTFMCLYYSTGYRKRNDKIGYLL